MKRICIRFLMFLLLTVLSAALFLCSVGAEESAQIGEQLPEEYTALEESLPQELRDLLPQGLFSANAEEAEEAVRGMSSFSYLFKTLTELLGVRIGDCLRILATVCGILLLSAVCNALRTSFCNEGLSRAFGFCSTLVITLALLAQSEVCLETVTTYFKNLNSITGALLPVSGILYAMGGNTGAAVASSAGLSVYMTLLEEAVGKTVLPFCGICMALALMGALDPSLRTGNLLSTVKKNYTTVLAFLMMLLLTMLSAQTLLGARRDSLMMRSVKFAAGSWIPVVGGSVAELLRTVSAGVGYLRGIVGISGILLLVLMLLPTLVELFLLRLTWQLAASAADLLGCDTEKKLLEEFSSILGYLIAAVSICSSVLLLSMTLLAHCASAVA